MEGLIHSFIDRCDASVVGLQQKNKRLGEKNVQLTNLVWDDPEKNRFPTEYKGEV